MVATAGGLRHHFPTPFHRPTQRGAQDDGAGRDAAADANEEHHGLRLHAHGLLHLHPQHHPGGGRPHAGKHAPRKDGCARIHSSSRAATMYMAPLSHLNIPPARCEPIHRCTRPCSGSGSGSSSSSSPGGPPLSRSEGIGSIVGWLHYASAQPFTHRTCTLL